MMAGSGGKLAAPGGVAGAAVADAAGPVAPELEAALGSRFTLAVVDPASPAASFAEEVRAGLAALPKHLPCRFFYDEEGSRLFEQICALPEYYVTRAERQVLERYADEIVAQLSVPVTLVELGSGSAAKTRLLIDALLRRQPALRYVPLDISRSALEESARSLLAIYPRLRVDAVAAEYGDGLRYLADQEVLAAGGGQPKLILWLGSNVGNLDRQAAAAFLRRVRAGMGLNDRLLLGVDRRKARAMLEPAYDDAQGVTARFNKNLLARINRELGGHFDLDAFAHRAVYDEVAGRIAMYLVSMRAQVVPIDALDLAVRFAAGEAIHTEDSYKYSDEEIAALAAAAGFAVERQWYDPCRWFCDCLLRPLAAAAGSAA
jgi:L-histidine N-alpha-methyltransferase